MAYNSSKGPQQHGDVKYEGDPIDTQIDFENDFIALKTNNSQRFIVSGSHITSSIPISCSSGVTAGSVAPAATTISAAHISSSLNISASAFYANGVEVGSGGGAVTAYNAAGDNRVITSVDGTTIQGEQNFTYNSSTNFLAVTGTMEVSGTLRGRELDWSRLAFQYGGTNEIFIPFERVTELVSPDWQCQFVAPYDGELKRILVRSELAQNGNFSASIFVGTDGIATIDNGTRVESAIGANSATYTTTTINFTGSNHFAAGDLVGIALKPRLNPGKINLACLWQYDKKSF